jgi:hypothetical protein
LPRVGSQEIVRASTGWAGHEGRVGRERGEGVPWIMLCNAPVTSGLGAGRGWVDSIVGSTPEHELCSVSVTWSLDSVGTEA